MADSTLSTVPSMSPIVTSTRCADSRPCSNVMKSSYIVSDALIPPAALTASAASRCELLDELGSGEELRHDHVVSRGEMLQGHCDREPSRRDSGVGRSGFPVAEE